MLKRFLIATAVACSVALAGCGQFKTTSEYLEKAADFVASPTTMYQVELAYDTAGKAAKRWRLACFSRPYKALMESDVYRLPCENRRERQRAIKKAKDNVAKLIADAKAYAAANPGGDVSGLVRAIWGSVQDFSRTIPAVQ